jgi:hypothetical protein
MRVPAWRDRRAGQHVVLHGHAIEAEALGGLGDPPNRVEGRAAPAVGQPDEDLDGRTHASIGCHRRCPATRTKRPSDGYG